MMRGLILCLLLCSCGDSSPIGQALAQQTFGNRISFELKQAQENNPNGMTNAGNGTDPNSCNWPGTAASGNLSVWFTEGHRQIRYAYWVATLGPNGGKAQLLMYDDIDYDMKVIAETPIDARSSPVVLGGWVADAMNQEILKASPQRNHKFLAVKVCGAARLYTSTVYVVTE